MSSSKYAPSTFSFIHVLSFSLSFYICLHVVIICCCWNLLKSGPVVNQTGSFQEKTPEVDQSPEAQQRRAELRAEAARDLAPWRNGCVTGENKLWTNCNAKLFNQLKLLANFELSALQLKHDFQWDSPHGPCLFDLDVGQVNIDNEERERRRASWPGLEFRSMSQELLGRDRYRL